MGSETNFKKASQRNPGWTRDELILALDLYFKQRPLRISHHHPEVIALSELLNCLGIHLNPPDKHTFRNPNSVYMKLCNFLPLDPGYKGKGLTRGGAEDARIWNEFSANLLDLAATAAAIRANAIGPIPEAPLLTDADVDDEFPEGRLLRRIHIARERNPKIVQLAKNRAFKLHGKLACEACEFEFSRRYGDWGKGYIECHHVIPVSQLIPGTKTKLKDIALLCSNCHRMIHRRRPWLGFSELKNLVNRTALD